MKKTTFHLILLSLIFNTFNWLLYFFNVYLFESILSKTIIVFIFPLPVFICYCILLFVVFKDINTLRDYGKQIIFSVTYNVIAGIVSFIIANECFSVGDSSFLNLTGIMEIFFAFANCFLFCLILIILGCVNAVNKKYCIIVAMLFLVVSIVGCVLLLKVPQ